MDDICYVQDRLETPNEEFMATLDAVAERHRTPAQDHLQNVRPRANEIQVTIRNQLL
jgi:hypothetical protein